MQVRSHICSVVQKDEGDLMVVRALLARVHKEMACKVQKALLGQETKEGSIAKACSIYEHRAFGETPSRGGLWLGVDFGLAFSLQPMEALS